MHYRLRKAIFLLFLSVFLVGAPLLVLYTAGYRLNFTTLRIQQTGVIALSSTPRGATILLNGNEIDSKTPFVIQRLSPGSYTIALKKEGYLSWEQRVDVSSGATTYITATLFADSTPELLQETAIVDIVGDRSGRFIDLLHPLNLETQTQTISRYDTVTKVTRMLVSLERTEEDFYTSLSLNRDESVLLLTNGIEYIGIDVATGMHIDEDDLLIAANPLPEYEFFDNGSHTEFRHTKTDTLITLLPPGAYTVRYTDDTQSMFADARGRSYLFTPSNGTVAHIGFPTDLIDANKDTTVFVGSDGNEIDVFDTTQNTITLLTRQSERIEGLHWHTDEQTVFCATSQRIFAVAREKHETRETTTLVQDANISGMWPDTTGKHIIFFGTVAEKTGLWTIALTQ